MAAEKAPLRPLAEVDTPGDPAMEVDATRSGPEKPDHYWDLVTDGFIEPFEPF
jgi:hypothetical protein